MKQTRLIIRKDGQDVSDEIELRERKGNPFGWSQARLVHVTRAGLADIAIPIGWLECGAPDIVEPGYTAELVDEDGPA